MNRKTLVTTLLLGTALAACSQLPKETYYTRGQPESLIDVSSEMVSFKITSPTSVDDVTIWMNHDQPTRAELKCPAGDGLCGEVSSALHQFGVPVKYTPSPDNTVALIYERIQARDCENRYIDNTINPYNLNHPTFGCTVSINMVQMVTDKREFTNPALTDYADANKTSQTMGFYNTPAGYTPPRDDSTFAPIVTEQSLQTSGLTGGTSR